MTLNPFLAPTTAVAYARGRPDYHPLAVAAVARLLGIDGPVGVALDIGCGTGLSSRAVREIATTVLGVDVSRPMLAAGTPRAGVHRAESTAERLPVRDGAVDLATVAAAFHWFDQPTVLREVLRVLRPGGGFAVWSDFHDGTVLDAPDCTDWLVGTYRTRFPAPARGPKFDPEVFAAAGLLVVGHEQWTHDVPMTADSLTEYLMSQSNATSAVDDGRAREPELRAWLRREIGARLPADRPVAARFTGTAWCCRAPNGATLDPTIRRGDPA